MFLDGFKVKSIYSKVKKELEARSYEPLNKKIKTVAILQREGKLFSHASIQTLINALDVHQKDVHTMTLVRKIEKKDQFETDIFSEKQIGWNGQLKSQGLKDFTNFPYDIFINYYDKQDLPLLAVNAFSKAYFKIGLREDFSEMNDLIVNVAVGNEKVFIEEVKKYMHILKMIN